MSLEKVAKGMGSAVKIIIYGFILLTAVGVIIAISVGGGDSKSEKPADVRKIDPMAVKNSNEVVESADASKVAALPASAPVVPQDSIESKVKVELLKLTPEGFNDIADAYTGIGLKVKITNESDKPIHGIKGSLSIKDAFDDEAGGFTIKVDETIKPGEVKTFDWVYSINVYRASDQKMTQLKKWTASFKAEKILVD